MTLRIPLRRVGKRFFEQFLDLFDESVDGKRFVHVIVDAKVACVLLVQTPFIRGNHDDPNSIVFDASEVLEYEKAALSGHHHVKDHQIGLVLFKFFGPQSAVGHMDHFEAEPLERKADGIRNFVIIIDNQDAGRSVFDFPGGLNGHRRFLFLGRWKQSRF